MSVMVKGGMKYLPKEFFIELDNTKSMYDLRRDSDAIRRLIEDLRIGREIKFALHNKVRK